MQDSLQPPLGSREERIAYNESWARGLNERKADWMRQGYVAAGFRCECWRAECDVRIPLTAADWDQVRSRPNRFAVSPGHLSPDVETVVEEQPDFWIVDKLGEAGRVAEELA